ncbi:hypothetical protein [Clostridium thermosuccinogenes]|uniref:hypothetical protein n=1 Tax=Clostridium thermosuccinogenes TaxID=84032 RepID=UPI001A9A585A|nr:hypothetical protein [Pseudoclostridium thermosuccinogenes]
MMILLFNSGQSKGFTLTLPIYLYSDLFAALNQITASLTVLLMQNKCTNSLAFNAKGVGNIEII